VALPEGGWAASLPDPKRACLRADVLRHARALGLPMRPEALDRPRTGARAAAAFPAACAAGAGAAFVRAVAGAAWLHDVDVDDADALGAALARAGLDPTLAHADPRRAPRLGAPGTTSLGTPFLRRGDASYWGHERVLAALQARPSGGRHEIDRDDERAAAHA
jgi:2-hydroxychromene-2-carboxylate isomerase